MIYALNDRDSQDSPTQVDTKQARELNKDSFGIFHVVNKFSGARRISSLVKVYYWYIEIDDGTKQQQLLALESAPLYPSIIVESARGYHAYWRADGASVDMEEWRRIVRFGLIPYFKADPKCSDPLRLLRRPGFYHHKDEEDPFLVREVLRTPYKYTPAQMMAAFPDARGESIKISEPVERETKWHMDGRVAIPLLNGTEWQNGESFTLEEQTNGKSNLVRSDGYQTGCFIDERGFFGNVRDGNSLAAWLRWYGNSWDKIAEKIKEMKSNV